VSASEASVLFDVVGEGAPVGLALVDTDLRFVRINEALASINGRPRELHLGRRLEEMVPEMASVLVPIYQHVLKTGEPVLERELTAEQPGTGSVRHVLASWFPVRSGDEIAGVGAVVIDVTDLKAAEMRLEGVLRQLPVGVVIADAAGQVVLENRRLGEMGIPVVEPGTPLEQSRPTAWHPDGRPYRDQDWPLSRSLRGEVVRGEEIEIRHQEGRHTFIECNSAPIRDAVGTIVAAVVTVQDVTERRQATQRQDLLVRAGEVLDSALGVEERLDRFARLLVPEVADFVKIELLEGKSGRRPVAIAHQDPAREALMRAWRERGTLAESERVGMARTFSTGEAKLTPDIVPEAVIRSAREATGEEGAELMREIAPRSQIVVPLRARGRVLGALSLTMAESGRHYDENDLDLARDLGLRAGLAVDNARLYEEAQASAVAEQRRAAQLDALAAASLAIHRTRRLERRVQLIAERARELIGTRQAVATMRPGQVDELSARSGVAEEHDARLSAPLIARDGAELGRISVTGKLEGDFTGGDEVLLGDLARIASLAIENARLDTREREIARTLQDSLLPRALPEIAGLGVAARYLAGGEGTVVGGDLYDVFAVEDEWALVVGDVCGKGAEAAALTSMVRYTLRAESVHHSSPREVLRLLNDAIIRQVGDARFCTVLYGRVTVDGDGARLVVASAGHPPPLVLRAGGRVEAVPAAGPLLGVVPAVVHPDVIVRLGHGDALVAYTDGVTEGRGSDGMFGDERLVRLLGGSAGLDADALVDRIVDAAVSFQGGRSQDDLAVLALRVPSVDRRA
jgi:PAS domain S-box-containing protein